MRDKGNKAMFFGWEPESIEYVQNAPKSIILC